MNNKTIEQYVCACLHNPEYMKNLIRRYDGASEDSSISHDQLSDAIIRLHKSVKEMAIRFNIYEPEE